MENEKEDKTENKCFNGSSIYGNGRSNYDRKTEIKEGSRGEKDDLKDGRKRDRQDSDNFQRDGKFVRRGKYFFFLFFFFFLFHSCPLFHSFIYLCFYLSNYLFAITVYFFDYLIFFRCYIFCCELFTISREFHTKFC